MPARKNKKRGEKGNPKQRKNRYSWKEVNMFYPEIEVTLQKKTKHYPSQLQKGKIFLAYLLQSKVQVH